MGPTWVLPAPDGPRVGRMNLAIRVFLSSRSSDCSGGTHRYPGVTGTWRYRCHVIFKCLKTWDWELPMNPWNRDAIKYKAMEVNLVVVHLPICMYITAYATDSGTHCDHLIKIRLHRRHNYCAFVCPLWFQCSCHMTPSYLSRENPKYIGCFKFFVRSKYC